MKLRLNKVFAAREWICLAGCLLAGAGVYVGLIQPSIALYAERGWAEAEARRAEKEVADLRAHYEDVQQQIVRSQLRLQEVGGSPPPAGEQDLQVARITSLAKACRVSIDQYLPIGSVEEEDHRAAFLQFSARGDFLALQEFFRRLESQIDFVDITHFAMTSGLQEEGAVCQLSWSCRINGVRPAPPPSKQAAADLRPSLTEVVLHEP